MLALTLGRPVGERAFSWSSALELARAERCAALAWIRSGDTIRRFAPAGIARAWRHEALRIAATSSFWEELLDSVMASLDAARVQPIVLKGIPLAQRLYGDSAARPCADLDLYVPAEQRAAAHDALVAAGWRWRLGDAPREANYVVQSKGREAILEVHSSLLDDGLVAHLPLPAPQSRGVWIGQRAIPAHDDDILPGFLATHLAKHAMPPLLWFIDFRALWSSLDESARRDAAAAAHAARVQRYLRWALRRAAAIDEAASGSLEALAVLGIVESGRGDRHNAARVMLLSSTLPDAIRVARAWLAPAELGGDWRQLRKLLETRFAKLSRRRVGQLRTYDGQRGPVEARGELRALAIDSDGFDSLVKELSLRDASFWIRVSGSSMQPSISAGAAVRLTSARTRGVTLDDVVLARAAPTPDGRAAHILHRVRRVHGDWVHLQGDANAGPDRPVRSSAILAFADAIMVGNEVRPIPRARVARLVRRMRSTLGSARAIGPRDRSEST